MHALFCWARSASEIPLQCFVFTLPVRRGKSGGAGVPQQVGALSIRSPLPPGWREAVDDQGHKTWHNQSTGTTVHVSPMDPYFIELRNRRRHAVTRCEGWGVAGDGSFGFYVPRWISGFMVQVPGEILFPQIVSGTIGGDVEGRVAAVMYSGCFAVMGHHALQSWASRRCMKRKWKERKCVAARMTFQGASGRSKVDMHTTNA